jgi:two-component system response regulator
MENQCRFITILAAEDDPDDRVLVQEAFKESNLDYELYFVQDGKKLLQYLNHQGSYGDPSIAPRPDLILLDLNMPGMDGRESLAQIKSNADFCSIPVVVLTNSSNEQDILQTYELGGAGFISKPSSFTGMMEIVEGLNKYWFEIVELTNGHRGNGNNHGSKYYID